MSLTKIIVIVGPTCSGKTDFSVRLAEKIKSEIISADSLQVYKEFSICTSKPTFEQLQKVKHHLIGHISVCEEYNVSRFVKEAEEKIKEISQKGMIPIIVGGTGLYIDALVNNFQFHKFTCENHLEGANNETLYNELIKIDPESARTIDKNDTRRLSRAVNFFKKFGFPISKQKEDTTLSEKKYDTIKIGLNFKDRNILYESINARVNEMVKNGLVEEVDRVRTLDVSKTASAAIGYKELLPYFEHQISLKDAIDKIKQETRRYAKRQITWFKRCKITKWHFLDETKNIDGININDVI